MQIVRRVLMFFFSNVNVMFTTCFEVFVKHNVNFTMCFDIFTNRKVNVTTCFDTFVKHNVNCVTCVDTCPKKMSIVRRVFDGPNAEVRYCCAICFSEMYEKRRRDTPGTFRNPARKIRHLLVKQMSILRRVFAYLRNARQFYDVF